MRHCVPSNVSSGLSNLPLAYVYTDGVPNVNQSTNRSLPTGESLSGRDTYLKFLEYFTTTQVTPEELSSNATSRLTQLFEEVSGELVETLSDVLVCLFVCLKGCSL